MDIRFSVPETVHSRFQAEAEKHGFIGRTAVSVYARHLAYEALELGTDRPRPIIIQLPTIDYRIDYMAYAAAKGRPSVEAWAAEAIATERNRTHLTARQLEVYEAVLEKLR